MPRKKPSRIRVLVGTRKGAFVFTSDARRRSWKHDGPHFAGQSVYHFLCDARDGRPALFAAVSSNWFGSDIHRSYDQGRKWQPTRGGLRFAEDSGLSTKCVWHIRPGRQEEPGVVYAGVDPAGLFKSADGGASWSEMPGLNRHPARSRWMPGAGGLIVHTILLDPENAQRMYVAISAAGVFRSDDGGITWQPRNRNTRADFLPEKLPELGQCVHKLVMAPGMPDKLYQQNHCGVYRTENGGDDWKDIARGLPSRFGFPIVVHPHEANTIWVIPMVAPKCAPFPAVSWPFIVPRMAGGTGANRVAGCHRETPTCWCCGKHSQPTSTILPDSISALKPAGSFTHLIKDRSGIYSLISCRRFFPLRRRPRERLRVSSRKAGMARIS
jgi:BNR/Asp-box repeat protein